MREAGLLEALCNAMAVWAPKCPADGRYVVNGLAWAISCVLPHNCVLPESMMVLPAPLVAYLQAWKPSPPSFSKSKVAPEYLTGPLRLLLVLVRRGRTDVKRTVAQLLARTRGLPAPPPPPPTPPKKPRAAALASESSSSSGSGSSSASALEPASAPAAAKAEATAAVAAPADDAKSAGAVLPPSASAETSAAPSTASATASADACAAASEAKPLLFSKGSLLLKKASYESQRLISTILFEASEVDRAWQKEQPLMFASIRSQDDGTIAGGRLLTPEAKAAADARAAAAAAAAAAEAQEAALNYRDSLRRHGGPGAGGHRESHAASGGNSQYRGSSRGARGAMPGAPSQYSRVPTPGSSAGSAPSAAYGGAGESLRAPASSVTPAQGYRGESDSRSYRDGSRGRPDSRSSDYRDGSNSRSDSRSYRDGSSASGPRDAPAGREYTRPRRERAPQAQAGASASPRRESVAPVGKNSVSSSSSSSSASSSSGRVPSSPGPSLGGSGSGSGEKGRAPRRAGTGGSEHPRYPQQQVISTGPCRPLAAQLSIFGGEAATSGRSTGSSMTTPISESESAAAAASFSGRTTRSGSPRPPERSPRAHNSGSKGDGPRPAAAAAALAGTTQGESSPSDESTRTAPGSDVPVTESSTAAPAPAASTPAGIKPEAATAAASRE